MAIAKHLDDHAPKGNKGDVLLTGTQCGEDFTFTFRRNRIKVTPSGGSWNSKLTEAEKMTVFKMLLADYRHRSMGDEGMKLAALGVTESGDIYIATNTERLSSPYFRQCAEMNLVTTMTQNEVYKQLRGNEEKLKEPHLKALYLMGGRDNEPPRRPICPCGNCTDMLSKVMLPGAPLYMIPPEEAGRVQPMNTSAKRILDVSPGQIWQTDINTLNAHREVRLEADASRAQRGGYLDMLKRGTILSEQEGRAQAQQLMEHLDPEGKKLHGIADLVGHLMNPQHLNALPEAALRESGEALAAVIKSAENMLLQRTSVPVLDASVEHGMPRSDAINRFMVKAIRHCFADRFHALHIPRETDTDGIEKIIHEKVEAIRCVVLRLDDGTFRYAVESRSKLDNAAPSAEMSALAAASASLGRHGVRDVWAMEMAPDDIAKGVLHTATKEGAERLLKRRSREANAVNFHFIPFNPGQGMSAKQVDNITLNYSGRELFPSYYFGVKQAAAMG